MPWDNLKHVNRTSIALQSHTWDGRRSHGGCATFPRHLAGKLCGATQRRPTFRRTLFAEAHFTGTFLRSIHAKQLESYPGSEPVLSTSAKALLLAYRDWHVGEQNFLVFETRLALGVPALSQLRMLLPQWMHLRFAGCSIATSAIAAMVSCRAR